MRLLGIGLNGAEKFCGLMDLPRPIFQSFYDRIVKQLRRKQRRNEADEDAIDIEGTSYAPGLDALWFVTKLYHFT